jgi:predicted metalloprotease with PDZ domain
VISYRVELADLHAHLYRVTVSVPEPAPLQRLSLPAWIPGSYLVREFARHLSGLQAFQGRQPRALQQLDKATWQVACDGNTALVVSALVYAFDHSVRAAFLGAARGFFNGTSLCLQVEGREQEAHRLALGPLPRGWEVATALPASGRAREFVATCYDELVDHPFEIGAFWRGEFKVRGVPHGFVVAGAWPGFDGARLLADAQRICEAQVNFWHGAGKPPMTHYLFLLNTVDDGYGGLEHRASTALIAARRDLPRPGQPASDGYLTLLGLISHEYFHTWSVKRLKPQPFARYDYTRENYTELLWFFEGFTSYYDDLMLVRCGLIDEARYIGLLGKTLNGVLGTPGRQVQSVAQASFDAWVKHYRSDENTPNATISYYSKGSLVALAFDLTLRSAGTGSLDDVMRALWAASGGGAIGEAEIALALQQVAGRSLAAELQAWVHGTEDLPLAPLLSAFGLTLRHEALGLGAALGMRLSEGPVTGVQVRQVLRGSAAERAGISAGDELLAVDGWRVRRFDDAAQWLAPGAAFELLLVRDQRVLRLQVTPDTTPPVKVALALAEPASKAAGTLRRAWLAG